MPKLIKVNLDGVEHDGREVDFKIVKEEWNEYELYDGGRVRLRTSAQKIIQVLDVDGRPLLNKDGDPHIMVRHNTQIVTST
ncbi:hypothetical protein ACFLUJ_05975 [Chloroflexota bacterium]